MQTILDNNGNIIAVVPEVSILPITIFDQYGNIVYVLF